MTFVTSQPEEDMVKQDLCFIGREGCGAPTIRHPHIGSAYEGSNPVSWCTLLVPAWEYGPYSKVILVVGLNLSVGFLKEQWKGFLCFAQLKQFSGLS